jgi:predicted DNA-binding transcriptional regulator AlpA
MAERIMTEKEVADEWKVAPTCLRNWRYEGRGPKFLRLGGGATIRYRESDVRQYLESCAVLPGDQSAQRLAAQ